LLTYLEPNPFLLQAPLCFQPFFTVMEPATAYREKKKLRDKYANSIQKADFRGLQLVVGWLMRCY